VILTMRP